MTLQLPDLRNHLIYQGKNGRPDAKAERPFLHFTFLNNPTPASIAAGEKLYLIYDKKRSPNQYVCSPNNEATPLWIEVASEGNEALVKVSMRDENGEIIRDPQLHAQFTLPEKDTHRPGKVWEMGKWRVDGSLLARQKARWMGQDCFLDRHGGEEFKHLLGKHRIDFTDEEESYSVYVGVGDSLIWDNGKWKLIQPGEQSLGHPLMVVKKIDERLMNFELWDIGGRGKMPLTLIKVNETWTALNLQDKFKFLGARTRSQYIFEIDGQRMHLSPRDWLLQSEDGWIKLSSSQQIDDYVERRLKGVLFVFDGVERKEGQQVLMGVVFNSSRNNMEDVAIAVQKGGGRATIPSEEDSEEDDDDDDDDDDEERERAAIPVKKRSLIRTIKQKTDKLTAVLQGNKS